MGKSINHLSINESSALLSATDNTRDKAIMALVINTGIFLNETALLTIDSINWDDHQLTVPGKRQRTIRLDDNTYNVLTRWSQDRIDSHTNAFFTTLKGKPEALSERSIDALIRRYAKTAGLPGKINARVLRNTFAIRLCSNSDTSRQEAFRILGITDPASLKRYMDAATLSFDVHPKSDSEPDNEPSFLTSLLSPLTRTEPKTAKVLSKVRGHIEAHPEEIVFGRDREIQDIKSRLTRGQSILLSGVPGIGKTHLLRHAAATIPNTHYIQSPTPAKDMLKSICQFLDPNTSFQTRASATVYLAYIKANASPDNILIIDNLHRLSASHMDTLEILLKQSTVLAATWTGKLKMPSMIWKFNLMELSPLSESAEKELIHYLTQNIPVSDEEMMENKIRSLACGHPMPIVDMVNQLRHEYVATPKAIRKLYHEGGIRYRDWSWALAALWGLMIMFRFIALGTHSFEGYILAGLGTSVFMTMRLIGRKVK